MSALKQKCKHKATGVLVGGEQLDLRRLTDPLLSFRETPEKHGKFVSIDLSAVDLGAQLTWKLVLDECLVLLKPNMPTTLKLSFTESRYITSSELAEYFFRRSNARVELLKKDQIMPRSYFWELSVNVTRTDQKNSLAIGIITNAKNELILRRATDSALRVLGRMPETEILVCGPSDLILKHLKDRDQIKIIDYQDVGLNESRITTKKNLIVSNSNAGYILLIHDRYEILDALPSALESFGFSFDVAVPGQITTGGKEFPGLAAKTRLNGRSKSLRIPVGHFHKNWYVNGGAILAKRDVLVSNPWNELLYWNDEEDVEISRRLNSVSVVPREMTQKILATHEPRRGYLRAFPKVHRNIKFGIGRLPNLIKNTVRARKH